MAEDDRVRVGEAGPKPLEAPPGGAGVVDHTQDYVPELQADRFGQLPPELGAVDIAVDRGDRAQLTQVGEHRRAAEVAGVDDQVGRAQGLEARIGQSPFSTWQMGVGDQREPNQSSDRSERRRLSSIRSR